MSQMVPQGTTRDRNEGERTTVTSAPDGYLSINQAADELGMSPWDVSRLVEEQQIASVTLVEAASLRTFKEAS
jgi:hypothetical protein